VAEVRVQTLIEAPGFVKRGVSGVAGDSLNGMTDTIRKSDKIACYTAPMRRKWAAFAQGADAHLRTRIAGVTGSVVWKPPPYNGLLNCHRSEFQPCNAAQIPSHEIGAG